MGIDHGWSFSDRMLPLSLFLIINVNAESKLECFSPDGRKDILPGEWNMRVKWMHTFLFQKGTMCEEIPGEWMGWVCCISPPLQWRKTGKILAALRFVYINLLHLIQWHWCLHQQCWCSCAFRWYFASVICFFVLKNPPPPTAVRRVLGEGDYRCFFVCLFTFCVFFTKQEV